MKENNKVDIQWSVEKRAVSELKEWDKNPRKIEGKEFESLKQSIVDRGFHDVVKVDADGTILSGHQRKRALTELGVEEVYVIYPNRALSEKEKEVVALESNKHRGEFDWDKLANEFDFGSFEVAGFKDFELGFARSKEEEGVDKDTLEESMDSYLGGNVKQITHYFSNAEYEDVMRRLDKVIQENGLTSNTEAFLKLLEYYENNRA